MASPGVGLVQIGWAVEMTEHENNQNNRVLIVDDQPEIHGDFRDILKPHGVMLSLDRLASFFGEDESATTLLPEVQLSHAKGGQEACDIVRIARTAEKSIALAFVDIRMPPGIDGVETARRLWQIDDNIEIVLMTAYTDKSLPEIVRGLPLPHKLLYLRKPFSREEIQQITLSLVGKWNMEQALAEKQRHLAASHRRLEAVLDATEDAMAMYDTEDRLVFANRSYERLFDLTEDQLKNLPPDALVTRFKEGFRGSGRPTPAEKFLLDAGWNGKEESEAGRGGERRMFYQSTTPVCDGQEVIGNLMVYRDVSKEIEVEQMKAEVLHLRKELGAVHSFDGIIGDSPAMRKVYALMERALESDVTVLIVGESGTGKEMVAKAFHFGGPRQSGPFIVINCAAIPETLIESELFGHEQGAFTGAITQRLGAFERAKGGTVLLDEVGDMPPLLQSKLLRVLQERKIQRLGGTVPIDVDVRLIAATNKNLEASVRTGEFREDLFYRLSVFPILLPPLRDRREDISVLVNHFLKKHTEHLNKSASSLSAATLRALLQYNWPGNVRELENVIERAVLLETTEVLQVHNLPRELSLPLFSEPRTDPWAPMAYLPLSEVERQAIVYTLELLSHNVAEAARVLGVNRATLYRKLKKYNLPTGL